MDLISCLIVGLGGRGHAEKKIDKPCLGHTILFRNFTIFYLNLTIISLYPFILSSMNLFNLL